MPLPPFYFPIYQFHFRLPEPGLHAQPWIETPPMPHIEGLHTIQWLDSDVSKLTTTIKGDFQTVALRNYDTGKLIPHVPVPPMLGPHLLDTLKESRYMALFHQPNVRMDKQQVAIFFWVLSAPWRCNEIKLPLPRFLQRRMASVARQKALGGSGMGAMAGALGFLADGADALGLTPGQDTASDDADGNAASDAEGAPATGPAKAPAPAPSAGDSPAADGGQKSDESAKKAQEYRESEAFVRKDQALEAQADRQKAAARAEERAKRKEDKEARQAKAAADKHAQQSDIEREKAGDAKGADAAEANAYARYHEGEASAKRKEADEASQKAAQHEAEAAHHSEEQANAARRSREADALADEHEVRAREDRERAAGVRGGAQGDSLSQSENHEVAAQEYRKTAKAEAQSAKEHGDNAEQAKKNQERAEREAARKTSQAQADEEKAQKHAAKARHYEERAKSEEQKKKAKAASAKAKQHARNAKRHRAAARETRRKRNRLRKQFGMKHPKKNPYKTATGAGNAPMLLPSLLAHIPFPCTVHIYMSWAMLGKNWLKGLAFFAADVIDMFAGLLFDGLLMPGKKGLAAWMQDFAKGLCTGTLAGGLRTWAMEDRVEIKVNLKAGPGSVTAQLNQDPKTEEWTWKASGKVSMKAKDKNATPATFDASAQAKGSASDPSIDEAHFDAKATAGEAEGNYKYDGDYKAGTSDEKAEIKYGPLNSQYESHSGPAGESNIIAVNQAPVDYSHGAPLLN
jgi:hypothetical protein